MKPRFKLADRIRKMDFNVISESYSIFRKNSIFEFIKFLNFSLNLVEHGDGGLVIASFVAIVIMVLPHFMKHTIDYGI